MAQFDCIERPLKRMFRRYGIFIAKFPYPFIIIPVLVSIGLSSGFFYLEKYSDPDVLFTYENSKVLQANKFLTEHFQQDADLKNWLRVTATSKDQSDPNIWKPSCMNEIINLNNIITSFKVSIEDSGEDVTFEDVCVQDPESGRCITGPILQLLRYDGDNIDKIEIGYPYHEMANPSYDPQKLPIAWYIGGVTTTDKETVNTVESMWLIYLTAKDNNNSIAWENAVRDKILREEIEVEGTYEHISLSVLSTTSVASELDNLAQQALPLFSATIFILLVFAVLVCLSTDWVVAKPWLAVSGIISASLAIVSGFGLLLFFMPFIDILAVVPFLGLGIGLDDMFVMLSSWRRTSRKLLNEERMGEAFSDAAVSITITTLTDILAIGFGAISYIPSVRTFWIFAAVVIFLDYIYQITFFAGCMVLTGRREANGFHALTCTLATPRAEAEHRSSCFKFWCTGGFSKYLKPDRYTRQGMAAMNIFRDEYGRFITLVPTKIVVALLYILYITFAIYGCLNVKQGLVLERVVPDDSYLVKDLVNWQTKHVDYDMPVYVMVKSDVEYWKQSQRDTIDEIIASFEQNKHFHNRNVSQVWTRDFDRLMKKYDVTVTQDNLVPQLLQMLQTEPSFKRYWNQIEFSEDNKRIITSRFILYPTGLLTPESKMQMLKDVWKLEKNSTIDIEVVGAMFKHYEAWIHVLPTLLKNFGIATAAVLFVCLLLIPNPLCCIYVALSIASICIGLIGYMTFWNISIDSVSMINIIMAVGFSVDFTAHLTYAFSIAPGRSKNDRARLALHSLGLPILQATLSTILAMLVLCNPTAYIFRVFFVTIFLTMLLGAVHGLIFIPVVLSLIGPPPLKTLDKSETSDLYDTTMTTVPRTSTQKRGSHDAWQRSFVFHPTHQHIQLDMSTNNEIVLQGQSGGIKAELKIQPYLQQKKLWTIDRYSAKKKRQAQKAKHWSDDSRSSTYDVHMARRYKSNSSKKKPTKEKPTQSANIDNIDYRAGAFGYQGPFWTNQYNNAYELNSTATDSQPYTDSSGFYSLGGDEADTTFQWVEANKWESSHI